MSTKRTSRAHDSLRTTVSRTLKGKANLTIQGKWYLASWCTPLGFGVDSDKTLIVNPDELEAVRTIVNGLANDDTAHAIARKIATDGTMPRRRGETGLRTIQGNTSVTDENAELQRIRHRVNRFAGQMADLAMGKFVLQVNDPASATQAIPGIRRDKSSNLPRYMFVWDVPDVFAGIPEGELEAAVSTVRTRYAKR